jgi:hypothetical protein
VAEPVPLHPTETIPIADLRPHPQNYRRHSEAQLDQLAASLSQHGVYRPVVIANDDTILAGHGVVLAAHRLGLTELPVTRVPIPSESPAALKIVTGDNELSILAETDERALADLLVAIRDGDPDGLLGTGYDEERLARLLVLSHDEITGDEARELWRGMPGFTSDEDTRLHVTVNFQSEEDRAEFARRLDVSVDELTTRFWWPHRVRDDARSLAYRDA